MNLLLIVCRVLGGTMQRTLLMSLMLLLWFSAGVCVSSASAQWQLVAEGKTGARTSHEKRKLVFLMQQGGEVSVLRIDPSTATAKLRDTP